MTFSGYDLIRQRAHKRAEMPPRPRFTRRPAWAPALMLVALLLVASAAPSRQQQPSWNIVPGQPLVDAVAQWGASNADMSYSIPEWTVVDLGNATFRRAADAQAVGGKAYARGTLSVSGSPIDILSADATPKCVIDTAQRAGLTPVLVTASLVLSDLSLFNVCLDDISWPGLGPSATATLLGIFPISPTVQQVLSHRTVVYMPRFDLVVLAYAVLVASSPWDAVANLYTRQFVGLAALLQQLQYEFRPYEVITWQKTSLRERIPDVTWVLRDVTKPNDPLVSFMRARGRVMEPRWCQNGTLVPQEIASQYVHPIWGPVWMEDTAPGMLSALVNATALATQQRATKMPIPAVMVFTPSLAVPEASLPGTKGQLHLNASLVLCGSLNATSTPVLDLTSRTTALFNVSGSAQLFVGWLALRVPALSQQPFTSALTLTSLAATTTTTTTSSALLQLYNATLVVPALDFLALATVVANSSGVRACMDAATLRRAAHLQQGIQVLRPTSAAWDSIALSSYTGWGVNATLLMVRPQAALPTSITQRCAISLAPGPAPPSPDSSGGGGGSPSSQTVGIIVGCTVGGVALLVLVAAAVLLWRRNRRNPSAYTPKPDLEQQTSEHGAMVGSPATAGSAPESKLVALLQSEERQLLGSAVPQPGSDQGGSNEASAVGGLDQAHAQLMSVVVAGRQGKLQPMDSAGLGSGSCSASSNPHQAVRQLAARLEAPAADAVTLERVLGRGGGGTVYLGKWRGMPVAVKTMVFEAWEGDDSGSGGAAASNKARLPYMRAIMETALSASLGHLHVVATYHYDIKRMDDGQPEGGGLQVMGADVVGGAAAAGARALAGVCTYKVFLVQELCTCSLQAAIDRGALRDEGLHSCLSLLHQAACGLEYLHGLGIIHGDLTPGNILLKADNADRSVIVKLADFGLSNRLEAQATHVSGFGAGTPFYVAPEVVTLRRTSPASDIFSLGVVAWELLSGEQPYVAGPGGALQRNPLFPKFPPGKEPPAEVLALLSRCLTANPRKRPSVKALLVGLDRLLTESKG